MNEGDIQPELPWDNGSGINPEETTTEKGFDSGTEESVTDIQQVDVSAQVFDKTRDIEEKIDSATKENDRGKVIVPDKDRDDAYLIYRILKEREGWETGSWSLFKIAEYRSNRKLTFEEVRRLRRKYCIVDHKRVGKNYYIWNDKYVFVDPKLEEPERQPTQKGPKPEDWWNYMGPIISLADADFRHEMDEELEKDKRDAQQSKE